MGRTQRRDVECTFLDAEGADHVAPLADVDPVQVLRGRPVRAFPSHKALHHYPGWWWSATMNDLVGYESLLERDCLMMADQDPDVRGIASQPFWLQGTLDDGQPVRHVPDYLLAHRDGSWTIVDVKPADLAEQPEVGKVLSWTGKVAAECGWDYQVWSGAPSVRLGNLHFLAQGCRPHLVLPEIVTAIHEVARPRTSLGSLQHKVNDHGGWPAPQVRSALLSCLWFGTVVVDLDRPLCDDLSAIHLSQLTTAQRRQVEQEYELLLPLMQKPVTPEELEIAATAQGISPRTLRRRLDRAAELGPAGLLDNRLTKQTRRSVDPRWDAACREVLAEMVNASTPTKQTVIRKTNQRFLETVPDGQVPSQAVAYRRLDELDKGRRTFGEAKQRRSVAHRPTGVLGQLTPTRPGEYVLMDGYRLDVFAMEPVTNRWVNTELTVAMDLYDRGIRGIRLRPVAAKAADVASVLFQMMTPQTWGTQPDSPVGPYSGVPDNLVIGTTGTFPDTIVVDHGKVYMANHTAATCRRLGISIQPAIPLKPTDKPAIERFFRTLRTGLLDKLPGYKGPNIASRGLDVEKGAFYYVTELEQIIREWVGQYHQMPHSGLVDPRLPHIELSPNQMHARGIAIAGQLRLPASKDLYYEFLECQWRTIQHYGVEINGRIYDGPALNAYRGTKSSYGGAHPGKWPFMVDVDDIRTIHFRDPATKQWHQLTWRQAHLLNAPFSEDAANYTRAQGVKENRHVDPDQAIHDLLARWSRDETLDRRARNLALRLASQPTAPNGQDAVMRASNPGVIDLITTPRPARAPSEITQPSCGTGMDPAMWQSRISVPWRRIRCRRFLTMETGTCSTRNS